MRNKLMFAAIFATLLCTGSFAAEAGKKAEVVAIAKTVASIAGVDESLEPSDSFKLVVDGREFKIVAEEPFDLAVKGETLKALLKVEPLKIFNYGGIELQYPRHFTFEADLDDEDVRLWNLSGSQCVLMIQRYPAEMDHKIMAEMLLPRFGEGNSQMSECGMRLNGSEVKGSRLKTTIGDSSISQEIFSFKVQDGSLLLIIQDTLDPAGEHSEEARRFKELLSSTFKLTPVG